MAASRLVTFVVTMVALLAGGLLFAACGSSDESAGTTSDIYATDSTPQTTAQTETTPPVEKPTVVQIAVVDGAPDGGIVRETVDQGDRVVLVVTSDVADEVHLHGYDITRDVAPGKVARLPFRATIPGRFEVELEDRGVPIADITVTT